MPPGSERHKAKQALTRKQKRARHIPGPKTRSEASRVQQTMGSPTAVNLSMRRRGLSVFIDRNPSRSIPRLTYEAATPKYAHRPKIVALRMRRGCFGPNRWSLTTGCFGPVAFPVCSRPGFVETGMVRGRGVVCGPGLVGAAVFWARGVQNAPPRRPPMPLFRCWDKGGFATKRK